MDYEPMTSMIMMVFCVVASVLSGCEQPHPVDECRSEIEELLGMSEALHGPTGCPERSRRLVEERLSSLRKAAYEMCSASEFYISWSTPSDVVRPAAWTPLPSASGYVRRCRYEPPGSCCCRAR